MINPTLKDMKAFLDERVLGVIATVDGTARPEAAYVGYACNDAYELVIGTSNQSRKVKNIGQNQSIAFVVADLTGEVQYEGEAEQIAAETYEAMLTAGTFKKLPGFDKYRDDPTQVYLQIKPTWARFIVHGDTDQSVVFEEFA